VISPFLDRLKSENWRDWQTDPPALGILIQCGYQLGHSSLALSSLSFSSVLYAQPHEIEKCHLHPGRFWRLTGIGREQLPGGWLSDSPPESAPVTMNDAGVYLQGTGWVIKKVKRRKKKNV
jgi:hypothetical protein